MKTFSRRGLETSMPTTVSGDGGQHAHRERAQRHREVVARVTMRVHLDAGRGLELEGRDHRPRAHGDHLPATWKSASLVSRMRELACSAASVERLRRAQMAGRGG